jgi:eukaryotic-like serine/threonine-protein kinase
MSEAEPSSPGSCPRQQPAVTCTLDRCALLQMEFAAAWRSGRPALSEYLDRVPGEDRVPLLRNLLAFEIPHRRGLGEAPCSGEYLAQLPAELGDVIREAFLSAQTWRIQTEVELGKIDTSHDDHLSDENQGGENLPQVSRLGDYRLLRELGRGGMGAVFEAVHVRRGHRVALKTLPTVTGESLHRFKREFRTLADVTHPNLVGLRTLECDGSQWFITLDLLDGTSFKQYVRPEGQLDLQRLRDCLGQ